MKKQTKREIARYCGQLKMLLSSGIPLLESLKIIYKLLKRKEYEALIQKISNGEALGEAMKGFFPAMIVSAIEGGERAGNLEEVLGRMAKYYEERAEVEEKVKGALIYPGFIVGLCFISLFIMFFFVLPGFKTMFADMNIELPLFTRIIIGAGELVTGHWYIPFSLVLFAGISAPICLRRENNIRKYDQLKLKVGFISRELIAQSFRTLGSLLEGGIPMLEALETTISSCHNHAFREILEKTKECVLNGERLSEAVAKHRVFQEEFIQMISVGEGSGKLGEMLISIAGFYDKEREVFIKNCTTLLEPALILFVGLCVAAVAAAMFLPMVNMISSLQ